MAKKSVKNKHCEHSKCKKKHDGTYGSGRFCGQKCARSFSTKKKRKKINKKVAKTLTTTRSKKKCQNPKCDKYFIPKRKKQICCNVQCAREKNIGKALSASREADWSAIIRKQYADGTRKPAGGTTKKHKYKKIKVSGKFELRACYILDSLLEAGMIEKWEYTDDRIPYSDDKGNRTYFPDFKVWDKLGPYYIEVKGIVRTNDPFKWLGALLAGHRLVVWREKHLREYEENLIFKIKV